MANKKTAATLTAEQTQILNLEAQNTEKTKLLDEIHTNLLKLDSLTDENGKPTKKFKFFNFVKYNYVEIFEVIKVIIKLVSKYKQLPITTLLT